MTDNVEHKIREIRAKLQELHQTRQTNPVLVDVKSKRETVSRLFSSIESKLQERAGVSRKEIEALTVQLIELSDELALEPKAEVLPRLNTLQEAIASYEFHLMDQFHQIKNSGFDDIKGVLDEHFKEANLDDEE